MAEPARAPGEAAAPDPTTEVILDAALSCFGTKGFDATSLSRVAAAAGVSRPTLYARYPDKVCLFRAIVERAYRNALDLIRLAPYSFQTPATTRARYRRDLSSFARLAARAVAR